MPRPNLAAALAPAALLLTALAVAGCDRSAPAPAGPRTEGGTAHGPLLAFEPSELDFGDLLPETPVTRSVRIRNTTSRPLMIAEAVSECACTVPTRPTEAIPPGGEIETEITMDAGKRQGTTLRRKVTYLLEGGETAELMVEGRVAMFIEHSPKELQEPVDEGAAVEIVLEAKDGVAFAILGTDPEGIAAGSGPPAVRQVVSIDWPRWRAAGSPVAFELYTDHPTAPPLGIVVRRAERP